MQIEDSYNLCSTVIVLSLRITTCLSLVTAQLVLPVVLASTRSSLWDEMLTHLIVTIEDNVWCFYRWYLYCEIV